MMGTVWPEAIALAGLITLGSVAPGSTSGNDEEHTVDCFSKYQNVWH